AMAAPPRRAARVKIREGTLCPAPMTTPLGGQVFGPARPRPLVIARSKRRVPSRFLGAVDSPQHGQMRGILARTMVQHDFFGTNLYTHGYVKSTGACGGCNAVLAAREHWRDWPVACDGQCVVPDICRPGQSGERGK